MLRQQPRRIHWALAACALCAYLACKEEEPRPGQVGDCGENCVGVPTTPYNPGIDGSGTAGSAGAGGGGGAAGSAGSSSTGLLTGSIQAVVAPDLTEGALAGAVQVRAPGGSVQQVTVDAATDGSFRLQGVNLSPSLWVGVGPFTNDPTSVFVDTLQVVSSTAAAPVELLVLRRSVLDELIPSFTSNPLELDPQRGHVILRFVDQAREGISGVRLLFPAPEETAIAYDFGGTYSDVVMETSTLGTLVLLNLATRAYPGVSMTVIAEVRGMSRNVDLHTAAGAVTLVTVVLP
jgi:hypothetical protein